MSGTEVVRKKASEVGCEKIVAGRTKDGKPRLCGQEALWFRMSGELTSTKAKLCKAHQALMVKLGYRLERMEEEPQKREEVF